jgi:5-methylcytosine-specific restriction endonuclease McrA
MKTCTKCKVEQPLSEFQRKASTKDGLQQWCKSCFRKRWNADPERNAKNAAAYRAAHYEDLRIKRLAYAAANREREAARAREWSKKNPERKRAGTLKWESENPERAKAIRLLIRHRRNSRAKSLPTFAISPKDIRRLLSSPCAVAGCNRTDIQIDHVVPVSRGGSHGIGNFQPLCSSHNQSKGAKTWMEFRKYLAEKESAAA